MTIEIIRGIVYCRLNCSSLDDLQILQEAFKFEDESFVFSKRKMLEKSYKRMLGAGWDIKWAKSGQHPICLKCEHAIKRGKVYTTPDGDSFHDVCAPWGWDGKHCLIDEAGVFRSGLYKLVAQACSALGEVTVRDERPQRRPRDGGKVLSFVMREAQEMCLESMFKEETGIIWSPTGSGKTNIMIEFCNQLDGSAIIITKGNSSLQQTYKRMRDELGDDQVGLIGLGKRKFGRIIIASPDTLVRVMSNSKYEARVCLADAFLVDECHHILAKRWLAINDALLAARFRFFFSATPFAKGDSNQARFKSVCGEPIFRYALTKWLKDSSIRFHAISILSPFSVSRDVAPSYADVCEAAYSALDRMMVLGRVCKTIVGSGRKLIVATESIPHSEMIEYHLKEMGLGVMRVDGSSHVNLRLKAIDRLVRGKVQVIVSTTIFNQAIDIPELNAFLYAGVQGEKDASGKSISRWFLQMIGRLMRGEADKAFFWLHDYKERRFLDHHHDEKIRTLTANGIRPIELLDPKNLVMVLKKLDGG